MYIQLLYFDDCPNWEAVHAMLTDILAELGLQERIDLVRVPDDEAAQRLRFFGSPTVRVQDKDVEPDRGQRDYMLGCRLYWVNGRPQGAPPREWLVTAIRNGTPYPTRS